MELRNVNQLPVHSLRMLTAEDVQGLTGLNYRAALELLHVHGLRIKGMWRISEAKLRKVLEG